ncbi:hypothetical protein E2C01_080160 [Portunus trituberculatus]|uniref:Uncharacterized protein n=1 Tax=Portunus trituberculatus TaxID=210409 RepID=A0A5B7IXN8_PORTR|nr:hypothetical protein [Portunus trituberculatus]
MATDEHEDFHYPYIMGGSGGRSHGRENMMEGGHQKISMTDLRNKEKDGDEPGKLMRKVCLIANNADDRDHVRDATFLFTRSPLKEESKG